MIFVLGKLLWALMRPGNLLVLILAAGVVLLLRGRRGGHELVIAATLGLVASTVLPLGPWAIAPLESRFPEPALPAQVDGIILLGGAIEGEITAAHGQVALNDAAERITETLTLARRFPGAVVLISGGDAAIVPDGAGEAEAMRSILVADGLDAGRARLEDRSRNTYENALFSKALAQPRPGQVWLLVTSAYHMPRAVGCFRRVGWTVLPYPVDYHTGPFSLESFSVQSRLHVLDLALHEWIGLAAYRVLGRTDALFPGPSPAPISSMSAR